MGPGDREQRLLIVVEPGADYCLLGLWPQARNLSPALKYLAARLFGAADRQVTCSLRNSTWRPTTLTFLANLARKVLRNEIVPIRQQLCPTKDGYAFPKQILADLHELYESLVAFDIYAVDALMLQKLSRF